jgi:hypothetical protein
MGSGGEVYIRAEGLDDRISISKMGYRKKSKSFYIMQITFIIGWD